MSVSKGQQASLVFDNPASLAARDIRPPTHLERWNPEQWPVAPDWARPVDAFLASAAGQQLGLFMAGRLADGAVIYPAQPFRALELTPLANVRVVILGQDPYHGAGQAHGLAFSVPAGVKVPPSLRNIFKELAREGVTPSGSGGSLEHWASQGVLLLNTSLTVEEGMPASHARQGWEALTDKLIGEISARSSPVVFLLWGGHAQTKGALIDCGRHLVLSANHPSPLSALRPPQPFIGCGHFSAVNEFLQRRGQEPVRW